MRFTRFFLYLAILVLFLAAGCGGAPQPAPPTSEPPLTISRIVPTVAATAIPTPTRAPLPPMVIGIAPDRGEEQVLDAPVTITFDQPMDPASTGAAFSIEPKASGEVQVKGNQLIFSPTGRLQRGAEYRVSLSATASSAAGLRLPQPVSFKFKTAGLLQVTSVQPAPAAVGVAVDAALVVAFNRPVVALPPFPPTLGGQGGPALPLVITPTVAGAGEWITTSIYRFTPFPPTLGGQGGLAASTGYTVTVRAGLEDTTGGLLSEPYTFTFRTADPTVLRWDLVRASHREGTDNVTPASPISVTFSLPMERAATEAAFRLVEIEGRTPSAPLAGVFTWNANGTVLGFKPARALKLGAQYRASVAMTARPANGQGALRAAASRDFTTVFPPKIIRTLPANGDTRVTPGGGISFQFASPINPASLVSGAVTIVPKPTRVITSYSEWDNTLYLDLDKLPDTVYTVTLAGKIADSYGNLLGQDFVLRFATRQYDSFVQLYSTGPVGTYNAYTPTTAAVTYRNVSQISFGLWNLPDAEFIALAGQGFWDKWRSYTPKPANLRREWQVETRAARNQIGVAVTRLDDRDGAALPPGLYYLAVDSETAQIVDQTETPGSQRQLIARATANVTLKAWAGGALAWVTDLKTGQPLAGAEVRFTDGLGVEQGATTNRDGIVEVTFDRPRQPWVTLLALARTPGGGFGVASTGWTSGIGPWDFRVNSDSSADPYNGVVYTDRPIYRPGQTVYWKAIIRRDNDAIYTLPPADGLNRQPVTVTINDGEGKTLWQRSVNLDGMGATHGSLALDTDASLGYYQISVRIPDPQPTKERDGTTVSMGFQVAEYRKPEYEVSAQTDRPEYVQGEQIKATVQANYFFGQPVKGAAVRWTLLSSDFAFQLPDSSPIFGGQGGGERGGPYSFGDWDWYATVRGPNFGGALSQGEGITDAEGRYTFTVPADGLSRLTKFSGSQRFTFDITILDTNGQTVSTQATAIVHKGAFYIGLRPQSYVSTAGEPVSVDVLTVNPQGKAEAEAKVEVIANRIRWYSVRERAEDGAYYWNSRAEKTPVFTQTVTTGADGTAVFTFTPDEAGEYKIEATGRDRAGHILRSATYAWVSDGLNRRAYTAWRQENNDRIQLISDKQEYKPGETARLLVASPYQTPVKALLTIERGGILTRTVIDIRGNSELLEIPIRPDFAPDVFAAVLLVKGIDETSPAPSFKMGLTALKVSVADKQLQVVLTPKGQESGGRSQEAEGGRQSPDLFAIAETLTPYASTHVAPDTQPAARNTPSGADLLAGLNPEQRAAVWCTDHPLVIVAGPGTGKTRTLTVRIAYLIQTRGVAPESVLAITFTNKAAGEMRERLEGLLGADVAGRITIQTFHAFGAQLLRAHAARLDLSPKFVILGEEDRAVLLRQACPELKAAEVEAVLAEISAAKNSGIEPSGGLSVVRTQPAKASSPDNELHQRYAVALRASDAVDFDDLILLPIRLLEEHPDVLAAVQARYRWISVDEYQDVNAAQYRLLRLLTAPPPPHPWGEQTHPPELGGRGANLCVIGDPDQAIYGFRGADPRYFLQFAQDYPGAVTLSLSRNYRSSQAILAAASQVIARNPDRKSVELLAQFADEVKLDVYRAPTDKAEAEYVVHQIEQMVGGTSYFSLDSARVTGETPAVARSFADFAVLYRLGAQSRLLIEAFDRSGIPYQTVGQTPLYEYKAVREVLAHLWLLYNPRAPLLVAQSAGWRDGLDPTDQPVARLIEQIAERLAEGRKKPVSDADADRLRQLALRAAPFGDRLGDFLEMTALQSETDAYDPRADRVTLMSLHASKGLEFPVVFIVGCEEGLLPYERKGEAVDVEEERRLFYVSLTRAGRKLVLTCARKRVLFGQFMENLPSRFVGDIEAALKEIQEQKYRPPERKPESKQLSLF